MNLLPNAGDIWEDYLGCKVKVNYVTDDGDYLTVYFENGTDRTWFTDVFVEQYVFHSCDGEEGKYVQEGIELPLEVFNDKPVNPKKAWDELKRICNK